MSKLDDFKLGDGTTLNPDEKQQIKDLMLELIGEDEAPDMAIERGRTAGQPKYSVRAHFINKTKAELRQKVAEL